MVDITMEFGCSVQQHFLCKDEFLKIAWVLGVNANRRNIFVGSEIAQQSIKNIEIQKM